MVRFAKMTESDKKFCLIYTGGTIGMVADKGGELHPPKKPEDFLEVAPELDGLFDYDFLPLINKDSTNILPADWTDMAVAIKVGIDSGKYRGFVIAHGTDTMHFSASAVAFALGKNLNLPVVFTGAQANPSVHHGDARINLLRAFKVANEDLAEVVISFGDFVFRGCRTQKKDERRFDAFESPALYPIADITENILIHPTAKRQNENTIEIIFRPNFAGNIVQVSLIPGLHPKSLEPLLDNGCKGIVLQSFGAGNVPDKEIGEYGFESFIKQAKTKNIPVIITSQFPANSTYDTHYAPGKNAERAGAIPTGNMTSAAATVKFRWVMAQVDQEIDDCNLTDLQKIDRLRELMCEVYVEEMDELK